MLPEVASGVIETRYIVTPVRDFCKKADFYEANVESIDLGRLVTMTHSIGKQSNPTSWDQHVLKYDYLVIALGSENNSFPAGATPSKLITNLPCEHDKGHRIIANDYSEVPRYEGVVYALGDCASITDAHTGDPYPATAQHAIRQGKIAARNMISEIDREKNKKTKFDYETKGMMAEIGKRTGVATVFGLKIHGFAAWWLWLTYYLANLPTFKKKLRVIGDWTSDLIFKPGVAMIKRSDMKANNTGNVKLQMTRNKNELSRTKDL